MRYLLFFIAFLSSFCLYAQEEDISIMGRLDTTEYNLTLNWRYTQGDNPEWSKVEFDDSEWTLYSNKNLTLLDSNQRVEEGEVFWFRKKFIVEESYDSLALLIHLRGALEVYFNGQLVKSIGGIGNDENSDPQGGMSDFTLFPVKKGEVNVLAARYQYRKSNRIILEKPSNYLAFDLYTYENLKTTGHEIKYVRNYDKFLPFNYLGLGVIGSLGILFLGLWVYTRETVNGYLFAMCASFILNIWLQIVTINSGTPPEFMRLTMILALFNMTLMPFIVYELLGRMKDKWIKLVGLLAAAFITLSFFFDTESFGFFLLLLVLFSIFRVCYLERHLHRKASIALPILSLILISPPLDQSIKLLFKIDLGIAEFLNITGAMFPLTMALYVVITMGKRTQALKKNLGEVERLSQEREELLSSQNEELERKVSQRTKDLKESLENLKSTQAQLIQSEKMASLGELTAGIAHEIQNPLNFVNNFSEVSNELVDEMNEEIEKGDLEEVKFIASDIKENLSKINHHGKRAGDIVRGMLDHSRKSDGQREPADINALADEYLRLSYHGLRAKDKSFTSDFETDLDTRIPKIEANSSDLSRVFLNLINNAFYEVDKKAKSSADSSFKPKVILKSKLIELDGNPSGAEFRVIDNADGIPAEIKDKIFQPFFTTKPTGSGTGLGLSLSYDIVKAHGGDLRVKSTPGEGTEMVIYLPIESQHKEM